jgi:signal transduction histidine kinase
MTASAPEEQSIVETLNRIAGSLTSRVDVESITQVVTDAATEATGAQFGAFFYNVNDAAGRRFSLFTLSGAPRAAFEEFGHPRATPVFAPTFEGKGIVRSDDITKDPRYGKWAPHHGMPPRHLPVRSYLAVPVLSRQGEVFGGLFFGHEDPGVFTDYHSRLVAAIAPWAAVAMENARLHEAERRARAEADDARLRAENANKAKSDFLASMSHELRTPLNAIGGYSDLLAGGIRGQLNDAQLADVARIKRSQLHLLSLINDILNFAKIESGRVSFECEDVSMNLALGALEELIAPQLLEKRLAYEYRCCDERFTAFVDPERLQQILLNLLSNSVKFTPSRGSILVECDASRDFMTVRVEDSGPGIPPDKLESVFEPFVQLQRTSVGKAMGTGLGLSISRDLARAMGGDLVAEERDGGAAFLLSLPRRDPNATGDRRSENGERRTEDGERRAEAEDRTESAFG